MLPFPSTAHNSPCSMQEDIMMSCSELPQIERYRSLPPSSSWHLIAKHVSEHTSEPCLTHLQGAGPLLQTDLPQAPLLTPKSSQNSRAPRACHHFPGERVCQRLSRERGDCAGPSRRMCGTSTVCCSGARCRRTRATPPTWPAARSWPCSSASSAASFSTSSQTVQHSTFLAEACTAAMHAHMMCPPSSTDLVCRLAQPFK